VQKSVTRAAALNADTPRDNDEVTFHVVVYAVDPATDAASCAAEAQVEVRPHANTRDCDRSPSPRHRMPSNSRQETRVPLTCR